MKKCLPGFIISLSIGILSIGVFRVSSAIAMEFVPNPIDLSERIELYLNPITRCSLAPPPTDEAINLAAVDQAHPAYGFALMTKKEFALTTLGGFLESSVSPLSNSPRSRCNSNEDDDSTQNEIAHAQYGFLVKLPATFFSRARLESVEYAMAQGGFKELIKEKGSSYRAVREVGGQTAHLVLRTQTLMPDAFAENPAAGKFIAKDVRPSPPVAIGIQEMSKFDKGMLAALQICRYYAASPGETLVACDSFTEIKKCSLEGKGLPRGLGFMRGVVGGRIHDGVKNGMRAELENLPARVSAAIGDFSR